MMNFVHKHVLFFLLFCFFPLCIISQKKESKHSDLYTYVKSDRKYIICINDNVDLVEALSQFCSDQEINSGTISGLGMAKEVTLRYSDPHKKRYSDKNIYEQVSIANLTGNISQVNNKVYPNIHAIIGRSDYSIEAGQLISAIVNGTFECVIEEFDVISEPRLCSDTEVNLYNIK